MRRNNIFIHWPFFLFFLFLFSLSLFLSRINWKTQHPEWFKLKCASSALCEMCISYYNSLFPSAVTARYTVFPRARTTHNIHIYIYYYKIRAYSVHTSIAGRSQCNFLKRRILRVCVCARVCVYLCACVRAYITWRSPIICWWYAAKMRIVVCAPRNLHKTDGQPFRRKTRSRHLLPNAGRSRGTGSSVIISLSRRIIFRSRNYTHTPYYSYYSSEWPRIGYI